MGAGADFGDVAPRRRLAAALALLAAAESEADVAAALVGHARAAAGCDGIALFRREGEAVRYLAEDAIGPLWSGQVLPIGACLSGTILLQNRPILVPDIRADRRLPLPTYASTFVRSLALYPIGAPRPLLGLGAYWAAPGPIGAEAQARLRSLAQAAGDALAIVRGIDRPRAPRFAAG